MKTVFFIESAYGEFAVTDKTEIASLKETKVRAKKTTTASKQTSHTNPAGSLTIDLHIEAIPGGRNIPEGQQLQFQMDTFRRIIRENLSHKGMTITFIHGIGDGILKTAIRKELDEKYLLEFLAVRKGIAYTFSQDKISVTHRFVGYEIHPFHLRLPVLAKILLINENIDDLRDKIITFRSLIDLADDAAFQRHREVSENRSIDILSLDGGPSCLLHLLRVILCAYDTNEV